MANLKAIRDRIQSVKILRKLQKPCAWRLLGVRRAQQQVIATRPFADLAQVLYGLQTRLRFEAVDLLLLRKREPGQSATGSFWRSWPCGSTTLSSVVLKAVLRTKGRGWTISMC